jgi:DNA-binding NarL/FixJ family response regulator
MLERILFPVIGYASIAAALSVCIYLFFTLKRVIDSAQRKAGADFHRLTEELQTLQARVSQLEGELTAPSAGKNAPQPPRSINVTKRTQALRMLRRGDGAERIAAAMGLSPREVQLLMKVQKLAADTASKATAEPA